MAEADTMLLDRVSRCYPHSAQHAARAGGRNTLGGPAAERCGHRSDGGTCYGDSGGPNFLGAGADETNIVAGTTITGDSMCRATNVDYRMDTPSARGFLRQFVALP
jgi:hypothetical protein